MNKIDPILEISANELNRKLHQQNDPILVDVQKSDGFASWNILNSVNIPLSELAEKEDFPACYQDREIITICPSGNKSKTAAKILQEKGMTAISLHGGLLAWNKILDPIEINIQDSNLKIFQIRRLAKGCLSYIIVNKGEAAIIDPAYNIDEYIKLTEENNLEIKHIFDTHLQADHVSGARLLADKTGAQLNLSNKDPFEFEFQPIEKRDSFKLGGETIITSVHSPGHTKGSTIYKIKEFGILSGDTVFVDGIGRPDLVDRSEEFASDLYHTIHNKVLTLPKNTFFAPSHHGKFTMDHIHHPVTAEIHSISQYEVVNLDQTDFIKHAVQAANRISKPPSYETIININAGRIDVTQEEINKLEAGPNRCAIN